MIKLIRIMTIPKNDSNFRIIVNVLEDLIWAFY